MDCFTPREASQPHVARQLFYCTVTFTIVLAVVAPDVAVTVMATGPGGVPALVVPVPVDVLAGVLVTAVHPVSINARQNAMVQTPNANPRCELARWLAVAAATSTASPANHTMKGQNGLGCAGSDGTFEATVVMSVI